LEIKKMATLTQEMLTYLAEQAGLKLSAGHTYAIQLGSATLSATSTYATRSELTTSGGYTAGGQNLTLNAASISGNNYVVTTSTNCSWTGSGAGYTRASIMLIDITASKLMTYINDAKTVAASVQDPVNTAVNALLRLGPATLS
jgi:hypothetical protein